MRATSYAGDLNEEIWEDEETRDAQAAEPDQVSLIDTVGSLRKDVWSLTDDLQRVLKENATLRREIGRTRRGHREGGRVSELEGVKDEVDLLTKLFERSSRHRPSRRRREEPREPARRRDRGSSLRQMLMLMLISEVL